MKKNIVTLAAANLAIGLVEFVFNMYLSRVLGAEGLGTLSLVSPINCLFLSFMTEGLVVTISKISARNQHFGDTGAMYRTVQVSTVFSFLWSVFLCFVVVLSADMIASGFLGDASLAQTIVATCPLMLLMSVSNITKGHFLGVSKITIPALINITEKLLRFPILYLLIRFLLNVTGLSTVTLVYLCYAIGELHSVLWLTVYYRLQKRESSKPTAKGWPAAGLMQGTAPSAGDATRAGAARFGTGRGCSSRAGVFGTASARGVAPGNPGISDILRPLIAGAAPICMTQCCLEFFNALSSVIVKARLCSIGLDSSEALELLGKYKGMVFPLMNYPMILVGAICAIVVPKIATFIAAGKFGPARRLQRRALGWALVIGLATSVLYMFTADGMGELFYKRDDLGALIRLAGLCAPVLYLSATSTSLLISIGHESESFRNSLLQQLLLLIGLTVFTGIPQLNIYGFLLAVACSVIVLLIQNLISIRRFFSGFTCDEVRHEMR